MNRLSMFALPLAGAVCFSALLLAQDKEKVEKTEAKKAADYLNKVRQGPDKFSKEIGADLSKVQARKTLKWNRILAKVAEQKAQDMADRDYFSHTTPEGLGINIMIHKAGYKLPAYMLKNKKDNFFESLGAGFGTGAEAVKQLILDEGIPNLGHRKHLLGMTDIYAKCVDIGVGCAKNPKSTYKIYWCFIVAFNERKDGSERQ